MLRPYQTMGGIIDLDPSRRNESGNRNPKLESKLSTQLDPACSTTTTSTPLSHSPKDKTRADDMGAGQVRVAQIVVG